MAGGAGLASLGQQDARHKVIKVMLQDALILAEHNDQLLGLHKP